jgi:hypothetical protein
MIRKTRHKVFKSKNEKLEGGKKPSYNARYMAITHTIPLGNHLRRDLFNDLGGFFYLSLLNSLVFLTLFFSKKGTSVISSLIA